MKKILMIILTTALCAGFGASLWADDLRNYEEESKAILARSTASTASTSSSSDSKSYLEMRNTTTKENTYEIAPEVFYQNFKQSGNSVNLRRKGVFEGIHAAYIFHPDDTEKWAVNVLHLDLSGDYGLVGYNYGDEGKIKTANNFIFEPRAWLGKDVDWKWLKLTPYVGFGYRWYYDQLKNKYSDANQDEGGFNKQTQYMYIPVGTEVSVLPAEGWRLTGSAEYDFVVWGNVTDYSSDATLGGLPSGSFSNLHYKLNGGNGIRGAIKIIKEGASVNLFVEPYVRFWDIKTSKEGSVSLFGFSFNHVPAEDKNTTTEFGMKFGADF